MQAVGFLLVVTTAFLLATVYLRYTRKERTPDDFRVIVSRSTGGRPVAFLKVETVHFPRIENMNLEVTTTPPPFPASFLFPFKEARFPGNKTEISRGSTVLSPPLKDVTACWGVPAGYTTRYPNPFVYHLQQARLGGSGNVLFFDNGTHALGVSSSICASVTGVSSAAPFWDTVRGDFLGCWRRERGNFLGLFCRLDATTIADVCPKVGDVVGNECLVVQTLV